MTTNRHLLGLLLGTEDDWPSVFEDLVRPARAGDRRRGHAARVRRRAGHDRAVRPARTSRRYDLVIDRLAYWYYSRASG